MVSIRCFPGGPSDYVAQLQHCHDLSGLSMLKVAQIILKADQ